MPISINAHHYFAYLAKRIDSHPNEAIKSNLRGYLDAGKLAFIAGDINTMLRCYAHINTKLSHS